MSKVNDFIKEIDKLSFDDLIERLYFLKKELFNLRFKQVMKEVTDTSKTRILKKNIARINTKLRKKNA